MRDSATIKGILCLQNLYICSLYGVSIGFLTWTHWVYPVEVSSRIIQVHLVLLVYSMGLVHKISEKPRGALLATGVPCAPGVL